PRVPRSSARRPPRGSRRRVPPLHDALRGARGRHRGAPRQDGGGGVRRHGVHRGRLRRRLIGATPEREKPGSADPARGTALQRPQRRELDERAHLASRRYWYLTVQPYAFVSAVATARFSFTAASASST